MKLEQIIKLKELGFSTDDILHLAPLMEEDLKSGIAPKVEEPSVKVEALKPEPIPEPKKEELKSVDVNAIMEKLNDLTTLIHASNISSSSSETPKTAEDVIAEIINPSYKKK